MANDNDYNVTQLFTRTHLAAAFKSEYVGEADVEFREYLIKCWSAYRANTEKYLAPYVMLLQSSRCGKSRAIHRLAEWRLAQDVALDDGTVDIAALYICMDNVQGKTGYPSATVNLSE
ncbi:hypothetical protein PHMEG_00037961 [Phytophthora megakarya]|uniref:Uncharacterized protein n=1 Tax=Phytophthora megakarya TaxID=4795 RepID=A0A225UIV5_9STRA|nr:hypothetical protein PHMEG_00037961 [Phytophthora megakarya]